MPHRYIPPHTQSTNIILQNLEKVKRKLRKKRERGTVIKIPKKGIFMTVPLSLTRRKLIKNKQERFAKKFFYDMIILILKKENEKNKGDKT